MVDKAQFIGLIAEKVAQCSNSEAFLNLHPVKMLLSSPLAKTISYSLIIVVAGYTTGILFEKVFPNLPSFRRNILGIRRKKASKSQSEKKNETLEEENIQLQLLSPSKRKKIQIMPLQFEESVISGQIAEIENTNFEKNEVPIYPLPAILVKMTELWTAVWKLANPGSFHLRWS